MRKYGRTKLAKCAAAERVLAHAVEADGYMVPGSRLLHYWSLVEGKPAPKEAKEARWTRLLEPALEEKRVRRAKRNGVSYYAPGHRRDLKPLPADNRPRSFGKTTQERCEKAEKALRAAATKAGEMVMGRKIEEAWNELALGEVTDGLRRWRRTLEPALVTGRVRSESLSRSQVFYAPADMPGLAPPEYPSDAARLVEATKRAQEQANSGVLAEAVAEIVVADSSLALESELSVGDMLPMLVNAGSLRSKRVFERGRAYYTTRSGPDWVSIKAMSPLDRRRRGVEYFWRATGGRPFSTRAIHRYTKSRETLRIPNDPVWGWTCGLQVLERNGEVVRVESEHRWFNLWAPSAEWAQLSEEERCERLYDGRPSPDAGLAQPSWGATREGEHDPAGFSRNEDIRRLVVEAKRHLSCESGHEPMKRPVSLSQVRAAANAHPHLLTAGTTLRSALSEAARRRNGMNASAIVRIGTLGRSAFYDIEVTEESRAYFDYLRAQRRADSPWLERGFRDLLDLTTADARGHFPVGAIILSAQLQLVHRMLEQRLAELAAAREHAHLLGSEIDRARESERRLLDQVRMLETISTARKLPLLPLAESPAARGRRKLPRQKRDSLIPVRRNPLRLAGGRPGDGSLVDYADVLDDLRDLEGIPSMYAPHLPTRLPVVRTRSYSRKTTFPGRARERAFDRPALICYAYLRWGGASTGWFGSLAAPALGLLRAAEPFIATLAEPTFKSAHPAAAAALGIMDTQSARQPITEMLQLIAGTSGSLASAKAAVFALGPCPIAPIASDLSGPEKDVLGSICKSSKDESLRRTAGRVLQAWRDRWGRDRLLMEV